MLADKNIRHESKVDTFFENAQRIFDVARTDSGAEASDFALLVRPDGSLHVIMETELNLDAVALDTGAQSAYRVSRSREGVRVSGRSGASRCELTCPGHSRSPLLRDQPLYLLASPGPLGISAA
jgi:hypothetical protein